MLGINQLFEKLNKTNFKKVEQILEQQILEQQILEQTQLFKKLNKYESAHLTLLPNIGERRNKARAKNNRRSNASPPNGVTSLGKRPRGGPRKS